MAKVRARFLIDTSALARMPVPAVREVLAPLLESGEAATCSVIDLEVLYSARNSEDYEEIRHRRALAYTPVPVGEETLARALEVQRELARRGRHRVAIPDLIIAAAAEVSHLTVLHYDRDFDQIAEVTGQPTQWVVPRGSV
ncbi:MAG: PIN domain nuclease [Thermoanaerobaculia bacterium]